MAFVGIYCHKILIKLLFWPASYSACVVYTKTIIHLSIGESGRYVPPLRKLKIKNVFLNKNLIILVGLHDLCHRRKYSLT